MPRPNAPPTPASSSDIRGKEGTSSVSAFNLPPTAYQERADRASTSSATPSVNDSDSSYRPVSPGLPANASRKRPASHQAPVVTKDDFALPPPPTRSRTIIQMKPRESDAQDTAASHSANGKAGSQAGKRKQNNSGQTAAGRKIARKTAHSLIERRRRSKMNQEFGVLKDMIPACRGQEMHKLAILQVKYYVTPRTSVTSKCSSNTFTGKHRIPALFGAMRGGFASQEHLPTSTTSRTTPTTV